MIDSGPAGERLYDTLIGRLSDPRGPRKLVAAANPGPTTTGYRRFVDPRSKQPQTRYVHVKLTDNPGSDLDFASASIVLLAGRLGVRAAEGLYAGVHRLGVGDPDVELAGDLDDRTGHAVELERLACLEILEH